MFKFECERKKYIAFLEIYLIVKCVICIIQIVTLPFFRFVAQKTLRDNEVSNSTEILPENWNENSTAYALRYVHEQKVYILLGTVANDTIILNLLVSICVRRERERELLIKCVFAFSFNFRTVNHYKLQIQRFISKTQ